MSYDGSRCTSSILASREKKSFDPDSFRAFCFQTLQQQSKGWLSLKLFASTKPPKKRRRATLTTALIVAPVSYSSFSSTGGYPSGFKLCTWPSQPRLWLGAPGMPFFLPICCATRSRDSRPGRSTIPRVPHLTGQWTDRDGWLGRIGAEGGKCDCGNFSETPRPRFASSESTSTVRYG